MEIVIAVFASTGLFSFVQFLIKRHDEKKGKSKQLADSIESLKRKIDRQEKDSCRTQLLVLLSDFPDMTDEILKVARHYFLDLKADWYMTSLFARWCNRAQIQLPSWANIKEENVNE